MKVTAGWLILSLITLGGFSAGLAAEFKDKVKVEIESVGLHPGMPPGMYVCAAGHLHIKGTVQNLAGVALGRIKVAGKAFGPDDKLLGTATSSTRQATVNPGEKAEINLEFLTVTGPLIRRVKRHEVTVVEALPRH
ncbi:MAG: FxLYD domain-containing protein [Candidatus Methylomirabilia bacterium]